MPTVEDMYNMVPGNVVAEARSHGLSDSMMRAALAKGDLASGFDPLVGTPTKDTAKSVDFQEIMSAVEQGKYYGNLPAKPVETPRSLPERNYMM